MSAAVRSKLPSVMLALRAFALPGAMAISIGVTPILAHAQQAAGVGVIEGVIRETGTGRAIEGAQVTISAAGLGSVTNSRGVYRLVNVPAREVVVKVRMVGYTPGSKTLTVGPGQTLTADFSLAQSAISLQAVVTTGTAGATEVKRLGNTVATIDPPKFAPINNASELLQGREPGVQAIATSGLAGEGMRIHIRGNASLTQSNEPIVFVDGVRINSQGSSSAGSSISRIDDIDPATIERMEILKGAAAATLYGTEASSGVIQIFTKRGVAGAPKWDFSANVDGSTFPTNRLDDNWGVATTQGQADSLKKMWGRSDIAPFKPFSQPILRNYFHTGVTKNASLSVTGGTPNLNYFVAGRYSYDDGPFNADALGGLAHDYSKRASASFNLSTFPTSKLRIGAHGQYINQYADRPEYGNNIYSPVTLLVFSKPDIANCRNSDPSGTDPDLGVASPGKCKLGGNATGSPGAFGTPTETAKRSSIIAADRFLSALDVQFIPSTQFNVQATLGVDYTSETTTNYQPFGYNVDGIINDHILGAKGIFQGNDREITIDTKANWTRDFGSTFNSAFVLGVQGFISKQTLPGSNGYDFPGPGIAITSALGNQFANDGVIEKINGGYFAQEQLGFKNYLFVTGGARYDYSSAFGKSAAGVLYPKVSVSFVPTDVPGWTFGPLSSWRLRAAWGQSGRQPDALAKFTTFQAAGGPSGAGLGPANIGNPDLKPEVATENEYGTEFGFLHDRLGIEATYWKRDIKDLLFAVQYPVSGGFTATQLTNVGTMKGEGAEIGIKAFVIQRPSLSVDLFANTALLRQKITSLGGSPQIKIAANYARIRNFLKVGYAPGEMFGARLLKVAPGFLPYQLPGNAKGTPATEAQMLAFLAGPVSYTNLFNGNIIMLENGLNSDLGKPTPDYTGAFGGAVTFQRNFRVNVLFEYKGGNYTYWCLVCGFRNASPRGTNSAAFARVQATLKDPASTPQMRLGAAKDWLSLASLTPYQGLNETSDGSFVRFRELSLTYTAPQSFANQLHARDMSITLSGRNLFLWTKYRGVDPEVTNTGRQTGNSPDNFFQENVDSFGLPIPRRIGLSVRLGY
ncbi:MAG TPA: SusC/RagA family TonB-linked outer membrane protein [Gemmatimonadaceae bacterium]|nr:SusC/RagA family TonB-linked outer membrane protein [Gemmatimonadaceae bacterium]